jgi:TonB-linked SusC/RagA family outer membrane protein
MMQFYKNWLRVLFFIGFIIAAQMAVAQVRTVTGKVVSAKDKQPLPGVTVAVKNTSKKVVTDISGSYSVEVKSDDVLVFSFIGFTNQEIPVSSVSGRTVNVSLSESVSSLNDVVVVGYGTQRRKDITGSVVSVDTKRLENLPNTSFVQALEGAVPGLTITQTTGGSEGSDNNIAIRGRRSITANNSPLVVLDGIPYNGSYSDINPSDIGSIEVLKDASAAAIYGSRGANGVILITTKKGATSKPVISYDGMYGFQKMGKIPQVFSPQEFYDYKKARNLPLLTQSEQAVYDSGNFPNYLKLGTRTGSRDQQSLSVRGGGNNSKYYISANYLDVQGLAINDQFKRLSTKINVDVDITPWLTFGTNNNLSYDDRSGLSPTFTGDYSVITFNPLTTPYNADGSLTIYPWPEKVFWANPLSPTLATNENHTYSIFTTNYAVIKFPFIKGLSYRLNTGIRYSSQNNYTYYDRRSKRGLEALGELNKIDNLGNDYTIENILDYSRSFGKHNISFTGLYSYENNLATGNTLNGTGFPNDQLTYFQANNALLLTPSSTYTKRSLLSQMGRLNYSYNSKYLLTLTARRDGSSAFGEDRKYGIFPIVAAGWNISNEKFMENFKALSNLKLRVSYGSVGNQAVGVYSTFAKLDNRPYVSNVNNTTTSAPGYIPTKLADQTLHWETTTTLNTGLDYGFFNGRIQGTIDVYSARTHDLLLDRSISTVSGVNKITQNIGKTANKGIDVGLNTENVKNKDFSWSSNVTLSLNRNKIVDLYGTGKNDTLNNWFIGHPIDNNFAYQYGGVWQTGEDFTKSPQPNVKAGYAKVIDQNGDGKITGSDRILLPDVQPKFTYGLGNNFVYRNWSLYVFVQGVQGTTKNNNTLVDVVNTEVEKNTYVKNYWTPTNPTNDYYANANQQTQYLPNTYNVHIYQNASYLRVKDILLTYRIPRKVLDKLKINRLNIFAEARNLFTITPWKGYDPEFVTYNTAGALTDSSVSGGIPLQKEIIFGLNLSL